MPTCPRCSRPATISSQRFCSVCGADLAQPAVGSGPTIASPARSSGSADASPRTSRTVQPLNLILLLAVVAASVYLPRVRPFGFLALFVFIVSALPNFGFILLGKLLGLRFDEINFGVGPSVLMFHPGGIPISLRLIPTGASVKFLGQDPEDVRNPPPDSYYALPYSRRIALQLIGPLTLVATAALLLGLTSAWDSFLRGFPQIVRGAIFRREYGAPLVKGLLDLIGTGAWTTAIGLLATKSAAFNMFPLRFMSGGGALLDLLRWLTCKPHLLLHESRLLPFELGFFFCICIGWAHALFLAARM